MKPFGTVAGILALSFSCSASADKLPEAAKAQSVREMKQTQEICEHTGAPKQACACLTGMGVAIGAFLTKEGIMAAGSDKGQEQFHAILGNLAPLCDEVFPKQ